MQGQFDEQKRGHKRYFIVPENDVVLSNYHNGMLQGIAEDLAISEVTRLLSYQHWRTPAASFLTHIENGMLLVTPPRILEDTTPVPFDLADPALLSQLRTYFAKYKP